ncbi:hypothetical protein EW146_g8362 [Bondarzewia mesenterica]|uniref:Clp1 C-terminal domain-containing protein n=1 Tax=Bondarzewia mesenterica TaxID=1095465 RepID=A0A4S4LF18_9AGAM|nr:hypothetical protein EW146_g8362 [Bondarzewia mesenterica]
MDRLIRNLGDNISERHDIDPEGRVAGLIVDTPSSFASSASSASTDHRYTLIKACVEAFRSAFTLPFSSALNLHFHCLLAFTRPPVPRGLYDTVNTILVVGHEKLNVEMHRTYGSRMTVIKIPKSGGVVELDAPYRHRVHVHQLHHYMYGPPLTPPPGLPPSTHASAGGETALDMHLAPSSSVIGFDELTIYRIGEESMAPSSALPIGAVRTVSEMQPVRIDPASPASGLFNAILALLAPPYHEDEAERYDEEVLDLPVVGFLAVMNIDVPNRRMTVLSPSPGSFAGRTAILGSFEWSEQ